MGYALRRIWLPQGVASLLWNQWQVCRGMRGNFAMESVASFAWNRWQLSYGTGGNFRAEYAVFLLCDEIFTLGRPLLLTVEPRS
jgi:hypothetical protein